jgi:hypothetical protein
MRQRFVWALWSLPVFSVLLHQVRAVNAQHAQGTIEMHTAIVYGTAPSPMRYRVLIPSIVEPMARLAPFGYENGVLLLHTLIGAVLLVAFFALLYRMLAHLFEVTVALLGVFAVASSVHVTLHWHYVPIHYDWLNALAILAVMDTCLKHYWLR